MKVFNEENITEITCCDPATWTNSYLACKIVISCLKEVTEVDAYMSQYKDKIRGCYEFLCNCFRFLVGLTVFCSLLTVKASDLPISIQLVIIDSDSLIQIWRINLPRWSWTSFFQYLSPGYPKLTALAQKFCASLGLPTFCKKVFSVMSTNKTKLRTKLTHQHFKWHPEIGCHSRFDTWYCRTCEG